MTQSSYHDLPRLLGLLSGDGKHAAAASSTLDVLWVLYRHVLAVGPDRVTDPDRDRFLLSKGHGPMAYYAVLAAHGFIDERQLAGFGSFESLLGHHPDRTLVPGVEIGSGSLGHGLGLGVGMALGLRAQGRTRPRVVVLVGDGELDEGSNAEAICFAAAAALDRLTVVVVDNDSATYRLTVGPAAPFAAAGWPVMAVDGRDHGALSRALADRRDRAGPEAVIARIGPRVGE